MFVCLLLFSWLQIQFLPLLLRLHYPSFTPIIFLSFWCSIFTALSNFILITKITFVSHLFDGFSKVFKVLALNCLVSAYMMSALYLRGLKQGDMQMTFSGLITASLFFFLSQVRTSVFYKQCYCISQYSRW